MPEQDIQEESRAPFLGEIETGIVGVQYHSAPSFSAQMRPLSKSQNGHLFSAMPRFEHSQGPLASGQGSLQRRGQSDKVAAEPRFPGGPNHENATDPGNLYRRRIGKTQIVDGQLKRWDSGGFEANDVVDLFVDKVDGNSIRVFSGTFNEFNRWEAGKAFGRIEEVNASHLKVIGGDGRAILPTLPQRPESGAKGKKVGKE
ncbi:MAG: hypothetical protein ABSG86_18940 [Thermoguttaceae bacterium]|jgi:hypothetical protein